MTETARRTMHRWPNLRAYVDHQFTLLDSQRRAPQGGVRESFKVHQTPYGDLVEDIYGWFNCAAHCR